jgi:hypothetical protein
VDAIERVSTLWREAQELIGDGGLVLDVADPLEVIEQVTRYFYGLGVHGAKTKAPIDDVRKCFNKALYALPWRPRTGMRGYATNRDARTSPLAKSSFVSLVLTMVSKQKSHLQQRQT